MVLDLSGSGSTRILVASDTKISLAIRQRISNGDALPSLPVNLGEHSVSLSSDGNDAARAGQFNNAVARGDRVTDGNEPDPNSYGQSVKPGIRNDDGVGVGHTGRVSQGSLTGQRLANLAGVRCRSQVAVRCSGGWRVPYQKAMESPSSDREVVVIQRLVVIAVLFVASSVGAQEFRVYTSVTAARDGQPVGPVLSRSNTIMHAGRSYDHIPEIGELVVCDPVKRQITLVHRGEIGAKLVFEELAQYVNVGRTETEKYAEEISTSSEGLVVAQALRFQLLPVFEKSLIGDKLVLDSELWRYEVSLAQEVDAGFASRYADYADMAARLNFVLHPKAFFPAVREQLNAEVRSAGRVPTRVLLSANLGDRVELVADHKYYWSLDDIDRRQVLKFDEMSNSNAIEWLSFRDYQQRMISGR